MSEAPTLTICLTSEQVDTLIFAIAYSNGWAWETGFRGQTPEQHHATRIQLLGDLRALVDPAEMTTEEILARES